jgi:uncharacterized protein YraI
MRRSVQRLAGTAAVVTTACAIVTAAPAANAATVKASTGTLYTIDSNTNVRTGPSTSARIIHTLGSGAGITIICYDYGTKVTSGPYTSSIWYWGTVYDDSGFADNGYVSATRVNTPHDPAPGVGRC